MLGNLHLVSQLRLDTSNAADAHFSSSSSVKQIKALTLLWCSPGETLSEEWAHLAQIVTESRCSAKATMDATMGSIAPTGLKGKLAALEESFNRFDAQRRLMELLLF